MKTLEKPEKNQQTSQKTLEKPKKTSRKYLESPVLLDFQTTSVPP